MSFDLNYRATFWKGREEELSEAFHQIASLADVLVGNEEDFQLCLGFTGPEAGGKDSLRQDRQLQGYDPAGKGQVQQCPGLCHHLCVRSSAPMSTCGGALMLADDQWYVEEPRPIPVMDRIGGGDGFTGGLLYGILKGWEAAKWVQFGWWLPGVLATTSLNDYAEPADEKQVWDIYAGNARVQR